MGRASIKDAGVKFTSENQPPGARKSRKGIPNRATVFKRWLKLKVGVDDPANEGEKLDVPLYEAAALGQLIAAMKGNHNAWKEIQDTLHGTIAQQHELSGKDGEPIREEWTVKIINGDGTAGNQDK